MTTPPQGNPFAQNQPPAQPQGQNPFAQGQTQTPPQGGIPQQPGFPQQGNPFGDAPAPPEQPRRKLSFKTIKNIVIVLVVAGVAIGTFIASRDDADQAAVGDCLKSASSSSNEMEIVECASADAEVEVLKKVDGTFTSLTAETECRKVEGATSFYTQTGDGSEFLLCLKAV
ncbi:hypothetical protein ABZX40_16905 [Streptomyces sp. NPDC004610]|uniref:LppU/SCO3897 family protein n=1 Tax=unclassified Streptomyces TaxID=2593676 RepID=UPI0033AFB47B